MPVNEAIKKPNRVLVVGCGGIGGVLAAHLHLAGVDVTIATPNTAVKQVWAKTGPRLDRRYVGGPLPTSKILSSAQESKLLFDVVFIAVQPPQIEKVAESLLGSLSDNARVVCLSNGLCEARLAGILGPGRIIGAVVAWGARMPEPGHYLRTSSGGFSVGRFEGDADVAFQNVCSLLEHIGRVETTDNLRGARFSKLSINCAVSALGTIGAQRLGTLLRHAQARRLGIALIREAVNVAHAEGIELEPVIHVDLAKLVSKDPDRLLGRAAQHTLLMAVGTRYRRLRSSMLAAIERGREPAVDYINGEISDRGRRLGVPTPFNDAARDVIWAISRGEIEAGPAALQSLQVQGRSPSP